jgi:release factor glutamine methyltransferase
MNIEQAIFYGSNQLKISSIPNYISEARILLGYSLNENLEYILLNKDKELSSDQLTDFTNYILRRSKYEPIAYIIGSKEFYGRKFKVNNHVLIPRCETELLIDVAKKYGGKKILDIATGSGIIAITLAIEMDAMMTATDISYEAIEIAKINSLNYNIYKKIHFIQSDWFNNLDSTKKFDLIISNPPYIAKNESHLMSQETLIYEPDLALFAEDNGLKSYIIIAQKARNFLNLNGKILLEIGFNQLNNICSIFESQNYKLEKIFKDLSNINRVVVFS